MTSDDVDLRPDQQMFPRQRQVFILKAVQRDGAVRVTDLARWLGVSDMTVRRDLDQLARQGLVEKVYGGATAVRPSSAEEPGFEAKVQTLQQQKDAIATAAVRLVTPGTAVGLAAGTTTWTLAHRLREVSGLTVVTNSINIAQVLHDGGAEQTVILTGGVRTPSDALVGPLSVAALRQLHVDIVIMGAHGIDLERGLTTPNLMEAETDRTFVQAGRRLVVVADHSKFGVAGISSFASLEEVDVLVTDSGLSPSRQALLAEHVGELIVAPDAAASPAPTNA